MDPRLTPATRALLRAAKTDGPTAAARAKVWTSVAGSVGGAAGVSAGAAGASAAAGSGVAGGSTAGAVAASKMLAIGTLLGGTVTVGLAALLLHVGPTPAPTPHAAPTLAVVAASPARFAGTAANPIADPPVEPAPPAEPSPPDVFAASPEGMVAAVPPGALATHSSALPSTSARSQAPTLDDNLAREAVLVAEARGALVRGDSHSALRSIHAARLLPSHQLGPEELAVEAQAFRALGREEEAADADSQLRKQFPESALAR